MPGKAIGFLLGDKDICPRLTLSSKIGGSRWRWVLVLGLLALIPKITEAQRLMITPRGEQVKTVNSGVIFTCSLIEFPGNDMPDIRWFNPDASEIVDVVGRVYVEKENDKSTKLYIRKIQSVDQGRYICRALYQGLTWEADTAIIIYEKIRFRETPMKVTAKVGENALIPCEAAGRPEPTISWRFKRLRVPGGSQTPIFQAIPEWSPDAKETYKYNYEREGLKVFSVEQSDAGYYECRAEVISQGALETRIIVLDVLYPPVMVTKPNSTAAIQGSDITLHCLALANPVVTYEWHKEQVLSGGIKLKVKLGRGQNKTSHTISKVTERDEGRYFCTAKNAIGSVEGHADITLMIPPAIDQLPHKVQVQGDVLILPCRVSGKPDPYITWQKVGSKTVYSGRTSSPDPRITVDDALAGHVRLIISGVQASDSGKYKCTATNKAGTRSRNATLTVEYKPEIHTPEVEEVYGWQGQMRTFNCSAQGEPVPGVMWFRKNEYLRSNGTYVITGRRGTSALQIHVGRYDHWIFGEYACVAKNPRGMARQRYYLHEAHPPPQPRNVTIAKETETEILLTADVGPAVGGLPVNSWRLMYAEAKGPIKKPKTFTFKKDEAMLVKGLKAGVAYNFLLAAGNTIGYGQEVKFKIKTPRKVPMEPTAAPIKTTTKDPLGGNHTLLRSKQEKGLEGEKRGVVSEKKDLPSTGSEFLLAIVGAVLAVILISLTAALAFFICRRKRHSEQRPRTVVKKKGKNKDVDDGLELNMRRKGSPLPDVVHKEGVGEVVANGHVVAGVVNADVTAASGTTQLACMSPHMHIKQRVAWNQMIRRAEMESEDEEDEHGQRGAPVEVSPDNELPPPPPFLLDSNPSNYADILDGYHSGDNVDDCLDEVDGQISTGYISSLPRQPNNVSYT